MSITIVCVGLSNTETVLTLRPFQESEILLISSNVFTSYLELFLDKLNQTLSRLLFYLKPI